MLTNAQSVRYLLIEMSGQLLALAMTHIASVQLIQDNLPETTPNHLPAIDLAQLMGKNAAPPTYAMILMDSNSLCAITVESVRPVRTVSFGDVLPLPPLLTQLPFVGVIRQPDELIPIIDVSRLMVSIRHLSPTMIMERHHAI